MLHRFNLKDANHCLKEKLSRDCYLLSPKTSSELILMNRDDAFYQLFIYLLNVIRFHF